MELLSSEKKTVDSLEPFCQKQGTWYFPKRPAEQPRNHKAPTQRTVFNTFMSFVYVCVLTDNRNLPLITKK